MTFCFKNYRYIFFGFVLSLFVPDSLWSASGFSVVTYSEDPGLIDSAMVRLGHLDEKFKNVGALFRVDETSIESSLVYVGSVGYLGNQQCIASADFLSKNSFAKYRVGFELGEEGFTYYDVDSVDHRYMNSEQSETIELLYNISFLHLSENVAGLTGLECCYPDSESFRTDQGMPFIHIGYGRSYDAEIIDGKRRGIQSLSSLDFESMLGLMFGSSILVRKSTPLILSQSMSGRCHMQCISSKGVAETTGMQGGMVFDSGFNFIGISIVKIETHIKPKVGIVDSLLGGFSGLLGLSQQSSAERVFFYNLVYLLGTDRDWIEERRRRV